jgi:hypothetical protein
VTIASPAASRLWPVVLIRAASARIDVGNSSRQQQPLAALRLCREPEG